MHASLLAMARLGRVRMPRAARASFVSMSVFPVRFSEGPGVHRPADFTMSKGWASAPRPSAAIAFRDLRSEKSWLPQVTQVSWHR